jgi:hypothetical protein
MVNNYESTNTLYHDSDTVNESAVSDICSYSINSGSVKTKDAFPIGDYFALVINDIGIAFVATVEKNNSLTCYVWTKFVVIYLIFLGKFGDSKFEHSQ